MAIKIPSKNIYGSPENPKVRDNVIERIEVGAVEVVPDNEYEVTIHNERIPIRVGSVNQSEGMSNATIQNIAEYLPVVAAGSRIYDNYCTITIKVKREKANSYVSKIYTGKKSDSKENYIQISKKFNQIAYYYQSDNAYTVTGDFTDTDKYGGYFNFNIIAYDDTVVKKKLFEKNISSIQNIRVVFNLKDTDMENGFVDKFETPTITEDNNYNVYTINDSQMGTDYKPAINAYQNLSSLETDLGGKLNITEDNDYYTISGLKIFVGRTTYSVASSLYAPTPFSPPLSYPAKVVEVQQNVLQAEITIYGDTIGIDLTDNTVYINGKSAKKVHSIDGNELMQTSNYLLDSGESAIDKMYGETKEHYKNGKETAKIRCSIGDYFEENGKKVISISENNGIPLEYQELEYIESQGKTGAVLNSGQYINTGYIPNGNTEVEVDFEVYSELNAYAYGTIFGSREASTVGEYQVTTYMAGGTGLHGTLRWDTISYDAGLVRNKRMQLSVNDGYYSTTLPIRIELDGRAGFSGYPLYIFALNQKNKAVQFGRVRLYSFKIKEERFMSGNEVLVRDFVPCYKKSTKEVGLYDRVGKKFYPNLGEGTFIKGKEIKSKMCFEEYDQVIPMVYGADGQDKPMSLTSDRKPKVFEVLGTNIFYDGAVWQELSLQEV